MMSALPPEADMCGAARHVCFGPIADIRAVATLGCDMDWSAWWLGSRERSNVTKDFYMGFDVLYSRPVLAAPIPGRRCRQLAIPLSACTAISILDRRVATRWIKNFHDCS